jgi:biopolymer transport protein ExbD
MAVFGSRKRVDHRPAADPNVIPFIDVLMVLLIIFMVTAPKPTTDLRVDMPAPGPPRIVAIAPTIIDVREAPGGFTVAVGAEEVDYRELGARALAHVLAADPALTPEDAHAHARLFVRADLGVAYQHVVGVIETLQEARFRQVAIVSQDADAL